MSDLNQQDSGDIEITNNNIDLVLGQEEVRQRLLQRLRTFLGEWFLDKSIGVPYFQDILVKNPNLNLVDAILKVEITETPGVLELLEYDSSLNKSTRQFSVTFTARTISGNVDVEVTI